MGQLDPENPATVRQHDAPYGLVRHIVPASGVLLLALFAYSNSLHGAFVFDDIQQIRDNPLIRDLGNYLTSWTAYRSMPSRYLAYATFALNYRLGGIEVTGYHVFNLFVHCSNALLVYALVLLTFRTPRLMSSALARSSRAVGFVAAAIFATHPLQTQAVTYIVQRVTSLASFFYLLTVVLYAWWRLGRGRARYPWARSAVLYGLSLLSAIAAMRTKEITFTLPFVVVLYEVFFFGSGRRTGPLPAAGGESLGWEAASPPPPPGAEPRIGTRVLQLLPFLATGLIIPLTLVRLDKPVGEALSDVSLVTRVQASVSRLDYLMTQAAVVATYLRLLVYPAGQNLDHDFTIYRSIFSTRVAGSLVLLFALAGLAAFLYRRTAAGIRPPLDGGFRLISFGIAWFFLALSVESSVIPIVDVMYEHRVYLPSAGLFVATAVACALLMRRISRENPARATVLAGVLAALLLAALTLKRNSVWADDVSLWTDAAAKAPAKSRPHANLGTALIERGMLAEGARELGEAVKLDPDLSYARAQLGAVLLALGRLAEAEPELREAIRLKPADPEAIFNLAMMLWQTGRASEAKVWFGRFLEVAPHSYDSARRIAAARSGR